MIFLKKMFHEICQKRLQNGISMLPVAPIIINTSRKDLGRHIILDRMLDFKNENLFEMDWFYKYSFLLLKENWIIEVTQN